MSFNTDLKKVLNRQQPEKVPFAVFSDLIPRGEFERTLRNRGVNMILSNASSIVKTENVEKFEMIDHTGRTVCIKTPHGDISAHFQTGHRALSDSGDIQDAFFVKGGQDFEPMKYVLKNTGFAVDEQMYQSHKQILGDEGLTHSWNDEGPFMGLQYLMGLENWSVFQFEYADEFQELMQEYENMQMRRLAAMLTAPDKDLHCLGNLAGNFSPRDFMKYDVPYYNKVGKKLKEYGCTTTIHMDAFNLSSFKDCQFSDYVDVFEAFSPPPFGDLSLAEARRCWGDKIIFHIHVPEVVIDRGREYSYHWCRDLILSDRNPNKILGMTELGLMGVSGDQYDRFCDGLHGILDAWDEFGRY